MLTGTIFITVGILTLYLSWHFYKNRHRFIASYRMYKTFLSSKEKLEKIQKNK